MSGHRNFKELEDKMSPEAITRSEEKHQAMKAAMSQQKMLGQIAKKAHDAWWDSWTGERPKGMCWENAAKAVEDAVLAPFPYVVYSGSEKYDLGDKRPSAYCQSQTQAEALIKSMWPGTGYWEIAARREAR